MDADSYVVGPLHSNLRLCHETAQRLKHLSGDDVCELGFNQIRLAYENDAENLSLGCGGSTPSEIKLLMLISEKWHTESSYAMVDGQVMNISGQRLEDVTAVVNFYDTKGDFITSGQALIAYNPILSNQTSPFTIPVAYNRL